MSRRLPTLIAVVIALGAAWCGGSSGTNPSRCVPDQSIACAGPAGCSGFQVCSADGSAYGPCACATEGGRVPTDSAAPEAGSPDTTEADSGGVDSAAADTTEADSRPADAAGAADVAANDAGDATTAGDAAPWSPLQLPGLALWLNGDVGVIADPAVSGGVRRWVDQSGNGNDANISNADRMIDVSAVNGHSAITCAAAGSGGLLTIPDAPLLDWGSGFLLNMVVKYDPAGQSYFFQKDAQNGGGIFFYVNAAFDFDFLVGGQHVVIAPSNLSRFHVVVLRAPSLAMDVDDLSATGAATMVDLSNTGAQVLLCNGVSLSRSAEMAEVVAAKGPPSTSDAEALKAYLKGKFHL
jgi:hypothetical protein